MKNNIVTTVIVAIVVGSLAFFGGMKYQESKTGSGNFARQFQSGANNRQGGQNGQGRFGGGSRPVMGEIIGVDDKTITVKLTDGSSKLVLLTDKTSISKASEGSKSDLKTGIKVLATGTDNSDGSITAQNIQINPTFRADQGRQNDQPQPTQ